MNDRCHNVQDLRLACIEDIPIIIHQDCFKKWWYHVYTDHFQIVRLLHISVNELEYFLLYRPEPSDFRRLGRDVAYETVSSAVWVQMTPNSG